jgi:hypothetical protein
MHTGGMSITHTAILAGAAIALVIITAAATLSRWDLVTPAGGGGLYRLDRWTGAVHRCVAPKGNDARMICD